MPFFRYRALDAQGNPRSGSVQAADAAEAARALQQGGLRSVQVQGQGQSVSVPRPAPAPRLTPTPAAPPVPAPVARVAISEAERWRFLEQLARFSRSGVGLPQALTQLAAQERKPKRREAIERMRDDVTNGSSLADALARTPGLFPESAVALVRAGEAAGFVPEALEAAADGAARNHRLRRNLSIYGIYLVLLAASYPVLLSAVRGALASMDRQEAAGGNLPPVATLTDSVRTEIVRALPWTLLAWAVAIGAWKIWHSDRLRLTRHALALRLPVIGPRAWAESLQRFGWAMGLAARAGLPARRVYDLAAAAVPNEALAARLRAVAGGAGETEPLSRVIARSRALREEHVHMIENGELAGDVPGALMQVARIAGTELDARDAALPRVANLLFYLPAGLLTALLALSLAGTWYGGIARRFLPE